MFERKWTLLISSLIPIKVLGVEASSCREWETSHGMVWDQHKTLLEENLFWMTCKKHETGWRFTFHQYNNPNNTAKGTLEWFKPKNWMCFNGPDIHPIENLRQDLLLIRSFLLITNLFLFQVIPCMWKGSKGVNTYARHCIVSALVLIR